MAQMKQKVKKRKGGIIMVVASCQRDSGQPRHSELTSPPVGGYFPTGTLLAQSGVESGLALLLLIEAAKCCSPLPT